MSEPDLTWRTAGVTAQGECSVSKILTRARARPERHRAHQIPTVHLSASCHTQTHTDARRQGYTPVPCPAQKKGMEQNGALIAVIGDEETVTGMLLAGVGNVDARRTSNFMVVDSSELPLAPPLPR